MTAERPLRIGVCPQPHSGSDTDLFMSAAQQIFIYKQFCQGDEICVLLSLRGQVRQLEDIPGPSRFSLGHRFSPTQARGGDGTPREAGVGGGHSVAKRGKSCLSSELPKSPQWDRNYGWIGL